MNPMVRAPMPHGSAPSALLLALLVAPAAAQCGYQTILPEAGFADSVAYAVSADGTVVVGSSMFGSAAASTRAFRWTAAQGLQSLPTLGGATSEAFGVSADGAVIVGQADTAARPRQPVIWTAQGTVLDLLASTGLSAVGQAEDASADGSVVVGYWSTGLAGDAFRWTQATGTLSLNLPSSGPFFPRANAVSDDGSAVVGRMGVGGQSRAFRWTAAGGVVDLGAPGSGFGEAYDVSADGEVVVGWADLGLGVAQAFRWTAATGMVPLGAGFGSNSQLRATNSDGSRAVGRISQPLTTAGAWSAATGAVPLDRWFPRGGSALATSENGVVVGYEYYDPFLGSTYAAVWSGSTLGTTYCAAATTNATGCVGRLDVNGSASVAANAMRLDAYALPQNTLAMFIVARATASVPMPGGSEGTLCLGGPIGRYSAPGQAQSTGASGTLGLAVDLSALPTPLGAVAAQPGETWTFQAWHRTAMSSNFSDAVAVTLE